MLHGARWHHDQSAVHAARAAVLGCQQAPALGCSAHGRRYTRAVRCVGHFATSHVVGYEWQGFMLTGADGTTGPRHGSMARSAGRHVPHACTPSARQAHADELREEPSSPTTRMTTPKSSTLALSIKQKQGCAHEVEVRARGPDRCLYHPASGAACVSGSSHKTFAPSHNKSVMLASRPGKGSGRAGVGVHMPAAVADAGSWAGRPCIVTVVNNPRSTVHTHHAHAPQHRDGRSMVAFVFLLQAAT